MSLTQSAPPLAQELAAYRRLRWRRRGLCLLLLALLLACCTADLAIGPSGLTIPRLLQVFWSPDTAPPALRVIVWQVRLPYALMAVVVGASLSLAGAEMQTVLNNPLASPFTLGISSAAALGAALALVLGRSLPFVPPAWMVPTNAFLFAFGTMALLQMMARLRGAGVDALVLLGIALVFACNAVVALLQYIASEQALQQLVFWSMGSLARANWPSLGTASLALAVCLPAALLAAWKLTALRLGEDRARALGIDVPRLRRWALLRVSLLAGLSVAFVGTIGFVGLVGPHAARLLVGEDHRFFLPASALCGAILLSGASILAKTLVPGMLLPIGIVTALIGVPVFMLLIFTRARRA